MKFVWAQDAQNPLLLRIGSDSFPRFSNLNLVSHLQFFQDIPHPSDRFGAFFNQFGRAGGGGRENRAGHRENISSLVQSRSDRVEGSGALRRFNDERPKG